MIFDRISNVASYFGINQELDLGLKHIQNIEFLTLAKGRNEVWDDQVFVNRIEYTTESEEHRVWEAHHDYLDIHLVFEGVEIVQISNISAMQETKAYSRDIDAALFDGKPEISAQMRPGMFLVCFPQDVHRSGVMVDEPSDVKKIVCKVLLSR